MPNKRPRSVRAKLAPEPGRTGSLRHHSDHSLQADFERNLAELQAILATPRARERLSRKSIRGSSAVSVPARLATHPKNAEFLILLFIPNSKARELAIGDLHEEYYTIILPQHGRLKAGIWYWAQALRSIGPLLSTALRSSRRLGWLLSAPGEIWDIVKHLLGLR